MSQRRYQHFFPYHINEVDEIGNPEHNSESSSMIWCGQSDRHKNPNANNYMKLKETLASNPVDL